MLARTPIVLAHEPPFRIGEAEFKPATREIEFGGARTVIEPRVMQFLVALQRADGGVVGKDDLTFLCWGGRIVGEDAINRVVSRARAVAERAGGQFRVETITKVGYRLVRGPSASPGESLTPASAGRHSRRELILMGTGVAALAAGGIGWTILGRSRVPPEAQMLVDEARKSLREGSLDSPDNAVGTLRRATDIAPDSAEAWGLLSYAYMIAASAAASQDDPDLRTRAIGAANRAFALEPYQADALTARLRMIPVYRNWFNYERACRSALRHRPHHPELMGHLAALLGSVGRFAEALPLLDSAKRQMPRAAPLLADRIVALWSLDQIEESDAAMAEAFRLLPRNFDIWATRFIYLMYSGHAGEAAAMLEDTESQPLGLEDPSGLLPLEVEAVRSGNPVLVRKAVEAGDRVARSGKGFVISSAIFAAFVGDRDQFFKLVNALFLNRGFTLPSAYFTRASGPYVGHEPSTQFLFSKPVAGARGDPRFAALTRDIGLDDYWARTGTRSRVVA